MRFEWCLLAVCWFASDVFAGVVTFSPNPAYWPELPHTEIELTVTVAPTNAAAVSSVDLVIGSSDVKVVGFEYDPTFIQNTAFRVPPNPFGFWHSPDIYVGGFFTAPQQAFVVGTVTVSVEGLFPGLYEIAVDTELDGFSGIADPFGNPEPLLGYGRIEIPEPIAAALALTGMIGLACSRVSGSQLRAKAARPRPMR